MKPTAPGITPDSRLSSPQLPLDTDGQPIIKQPKALQQHYPRLPDKNSPLFWLCAYLRDVAELNELRTMRDKLYATSRNDVLQRAMGNAATTQMLETGKSLKYVIEGGQLLFAFPGTTAMQGGAA
jgi:hypothetical protein